MAVSHITTVRNTLADTVVDLVDVGATDANGDLFYTTAVDAEVATLEFAVTAFGAAAAGIATANAIVSDTNAAGGLLALFQFRDRNNAEILRGSITVTAGGGDIEISNLTIGAGDTVSCSTLTYESAV